MNNDVFDIFDHGRVILDVYYQSFAKRRTIMDSYLNR